jgi:hypothetical protein
MKTCKKCHDEKTPEDFELIRRNVCRKCVEVQNKKSRHFRRRTEGEKLRNLRKTYRIRLMKLWAKIIAIDDEIDNLVKEKANGSRRVL